MSETAPKKIVINSCFGRFSLSEKAFRLYLDRKGIAYDVEEHSESIWNPRFKRPTTESMDDDPYLDDSDIDRDDPDLVFVIEELGCEEASGDMANLRIVEIPSDVDCWTIRNYDGMESIHECHRTWS